MKPIASLQFPEAPKSTAPHERLHHEANPGALVAQSDRVDVTARGARMLAAFDRPSFPNRSSAPITRGSCTTELMLRPVSRARHQAAAQGSCTADPLFRPVSRGERRIRPHRPPVRIELTSPLRLPETTRHARLHGLLELMMPTRRTRLPEPGSSAPLRAVRA